MSKVLAVILAGGQGARLSLLSQKRAKPAVPFAGKYRIIEFALSNCVNSGISDVAVLTQYRPHSLHDHIGIGKPWDLDREKGGVHLLQPYIGRPESEWYQGTADAVYQNLDFIMEGRYDYVLVLAGDHIYRMDYRQFLTRHYESDADVTVSVTPCDEKSAGETTIARFRSTQNAFAVIQIQIATHFARLHIAGRQPSYPKARWHSNCTRLHRRKSMPKEDGNETYIVRRSVCE